MVQYLGILERHASQKQFRWHGRGIVDAPELKNIDMGIYREFRLTEGKTLMFRTEMSNSLNLVNLSNPGTNANTTSTFGKISSAGPMRQIQLGLRLRF